MTLIQNALVAAALASIPLVATGASAQSTITGQLTFNTPTGTNYFDPVNGFVPAGYGNTSGTTVPIGSGTEFGFMDEINTDTADFTGTSLTIRDVGTDGAVPFYMRFTSNVPNFFSNAAFTSNNFGIGSAFSVVGNTLIFNSPGAASAGTQTAVITFGAPAAAVPEPATWAMMILGMGAIGFAMRRKKVTTQVSYAA